MTQETTQLQKAIKIAVKDGWVESSVKQYYSKGDIKYVYSKGLHQRYTTDLNYLMPIAVKVLGKVGECSGWSFFAPYMRLKDAILALTLDFNNQYTELFEALFNAIKILENE